MGTAWNGKEIRDGFTLTKRCAAVMGRLKRPSGSEATEVILASGTSPWRRALMVNPAFVNVPETQGTAVLVASSILTWCQTNGHQGNAVATVAI
jgi:hypothetical protein